MLKLFLWLKNLRRKKIVLLSIVAVALSCALLIVVASIFSGFIKAVETSASDVVGDIVIKPPVRFAGSDILIDELQKLRRRQGRHRRSFRARGCFASTAAMCVR